MNELFFFVFLEEKCMTMMFFALHEGDYWQCCQRNGKKKKKDPNEMISVFLLVCLCSFVLL